MKVKNLLPLIIFTILAVALTVTLFVLLYKPLSPAKIVGLGFLVFAEIASTVSAIVMFTKKRGSLLSTAGVSVALGLYFISSLILALLSPIFEEKVWLEVTLELVAIFILGLIATSILFVGKYVDNVDKQTKKKLENGEFNKPKRGGF